MNQKKLSTVLWLLILGTLIWVFCAQVSKISNENWLKETYPTELKTVKVFPVAIDSIAKSYHYYYDGSDYASSIEEYKIFAQNQTYEMISLDYFDTKTPCIKGDSAYITQLYNGRCLISKEVLPYKKIEEINMENVASSKFLWRMTGLIFALIIVSLVCGANLHQLFRK